MRILGRILLGLLALIVLAVVAVVAFVYLAVDDSYPQVDGEIQLPGLQAQVDVYRDENGIPHIYASTEHDLFFAQGYVHAQDRFWQMDFNRHVGSGRLSEMLGDATLDTDMFLRTVGWERVARAELELMDAESLAMLQAYSDGVNAYLADRNGTELSLEYMFLGLLNSNYEPAPWEPVNTLTWAKAMAWDLRDNMDNEIERAILLNTLPAERVNELYPAYPDNHPIILPDFALDGAAAPAQPGLSFALNDMLPELRGQIAAADLLLGGAPFEELGSNSWVVSGERSATGAPLLANDPHLSTGIPSIWYQIGLHCQPKGPDCDYETAGVSFVGAPGIVIGHNDRIAWGLTNVGADVMDLYIIKVNPDNPLQYEMDGEWVDMDIVEEPVQVAGGDTIDLDVRMTRFGPIITEVFGDLDTLAENSGADLPENYAIALRWTALEPGNTFQSIFMINRAQNFEEFRAAASQFVAPSQNLLYADVDGNIGYQMPGHIPMRGAGDGRTMSPGWTSEYDWLGYIPFEELPYGLNPESGYIVAANNAIVGAEYPYLIADYWDYGYRAQRIVDLIEGALGPIDIAYYQQMQGDSVNLGALEIIPALADLPFEGEVADLRDELLAWDGDQTHESEMSVLFNSFWIELLKGTFHDELPEDYWPTGGANSYIVVSKLLTEPDNAWWDSEDTEATESRDDILQAAFNAAATEFNGEQTWAGVHGKTFLHETMDSFPVIGGLFNRGPFGTAGGHSIVNANNWDAATGTFDVTSLPSKRSIFDMSDWQNSLQIHTTGQSGHAYHEHYIDMAPLWADLQYLPLHWNLDAIEAAAEGHLTLTPGE